MNIVYLSHRVPFPPNKGEKIRTFHQIQFLAKKGHNIVLFFPSESENDHQYAEELKSNYCNKVYFEKKPGKIALIQALLTATPLSVNNFYSSILQHSIDDYFSHNPVDAVVCTSSSMAEYVFKSKTDILNSAATTIMDFMDLDSDKWRQYSQIKGFPLRYIYSRESSLLCEYEKKIYEAFDRSIFISQNEVNLFKRSLNHTDKLYSVANGIDVESFKPQEHKPQDGPNLLFTGVMDYLPNVDAVCWFSENIWLKVRERFPEAKFYIAGMNPNAKVRALEELPGITVTGFVEDIHHYFDNAHLFVAPFRLARGVQNKVLQAFASGLPTVGTSMAAEGINCENGKHIAIADSPDLFLENVIDILSNTSKAKEIGDNAAQLILDEYSWESILNGFETLLKH